MSEQLFGRRWQATVFSLDGSTKVLEAESVPYGRQESIRVEFRVEQFGYKCFWYADLVFYNLALEVINVLIEGMPVTFSAGYDDPARYGQIFKGVLFQLLLDRENNVDVRTTLHCLIGKLELTENFISGNLAAVLMSQSGICKWLLANSLHPIPEGNIAEMPKKQPRGMTFFGNPRRYLESMADENNLQAFFGVDGYSMGAITDKPAAPNAQVITPETGLIGVPQQIMYGVRFRTLLDPRIKVQYPAYQVKLDQTLVARMRRLIDQPVSVLDQSGYYNVGQVVHYGDSRGNDWYTEVTAYTPVYGRVGALGIPTDVEPGQPQEIN